MINLECCYLLQVLYSLLLVRTRHAMQESRMAEDKARPACRSYQCRALRQRHRLDIKGSHGINPWRVVITLNSDPVAPSRRENRISWESCYSNCYMFCSFLLFGHTVFCGKRA